jgi:hypothetical protein
VKTEDVNWIAIEVAAIIKKRLIKYRMGEPLAHQESLLLAHAREVHHAHSHVRGHLAGGAHATHLCGPGAAALAHVAKEAFLRIHRAVHVHAAILESIAIMTPTHSHHFIHFPHLVHVHHFIPPQFPFQSKHLMTGIKANIAQLNRELIVNCTEIYYIYSIYYREK